MGKHDQHHADPRSFHLRSRSMRRRSDATRTRRRSPLERNPGSRTSDRSRRHDHHEHEPQPADTKARREAELQRTIETAKTENVEIMDDITIPDLTYLMIEDAISMQAILKIFDVSATPLELRTSTRQIDILKAFDKSKAHGHAVQMLNKSEVVNWFTPTSLAVKSRHPGCTVYEFLELLDQHLINESAMHKILEQDTVNSIDQYRRTFMHLTEGTNQELIAKSIAVEARPKMPAELSTPHPEVSVKAPPAAMASHIGQPPPEPMAPAPVPNPEYHPPPPPPAEPIHRPPAKAMPHHDANQGRHYYSCQGYCGCGRWCQKAHDHDGPHECEQCRTR